MKAQTQGEQKTGVELIAQERKEQIEKHGRSIESDVANNDAGQMLWMAEWLIQAGNFSEDAALRVATSYCPYDWNEKIIFKMMMKPPKQRLIIAGALIAAEIDRLQNIEP